MSSNTLHILNQGPVLGTLAKAFWQSVAGATGKGIPAELPGRWLATTVGPRPDNLVNDYIRNVGGASASYKGIVPIHFFPQFAFPLMARTLEDLPWKMAKIINGGCSITINGSLPRGKALRLRARLESLEETDRLAKMTQRLLVGTDQSPEIIDVVQTSLVPLSKPGQSSTSGKKDRPRVPVRVREIGRFKAAANAGLEYAFLTGDFNPLHWVGPFARLSGFKGPILHGFATLARTIEILNKNLFAGDVRCLKQISVRFTRPLVLPGEAGVYHDESGGVYTGSGPNGPAYLSGTMLYR